MKSGGSLQASPNSRGRGYRRNFRGRGPDPTLFGVGGRTPLYKYRYTKSEILLGPHFSDQSYATGRGSIPPVGTPLLAN